MDCAGLASTQNRSGAPLLPLRVSLTLLAILGLVSFLLAACITAKLRRDVFDPSPENPSPVPTVRNVIDFGTIAKGGRGELEFSLHNSAEKSIDPQAFQTSCDCLKLVLEPSDIPPGGTANAKAVVDFSKDPEFSGRLRITASVHCSSSPSDLVEIVAYVRVE
jgi:hypothetical protein